MWYPKVNQAAINRKRSGKRSKFDPACDIILLPSAATEECLERNPVYAAGDLQNTS